MIGCTISHYEILEKLGEGGMGVVYKARDTHLDRFVAIKVLPPETVADAERKRRFVQEARSASALNHPNIITIYDIDLVDGVDFIAMEFVAGKTLDGLIPQGGMPLNDVLKCSVQIADALAAAHGAGIVHRDLKPANIIVGGDGRVRLLDFGLAKLTEERRQAACAAETSAAASDEQPTVLPAPATVAGAIAGTLAYMSPEQAEGAKVDARSDIFSFGVVLYEMLTGRRAFQRASPAATLSAVLREEPALENASAGLARIVRRALAKDPRERFPSATELRQALDALESRGPAAVHPCIAVLPFTNLSPDKENEYIGDGLAEEIINALTGLPGLRVVARTSAFAFRGKEQDAREIGARLNATHILEGSVRRAGSRIRVTAQLVTAEDGCHLWSKRYDREVVDVFAIQDEICGGIVDELRVQLRGDAPLVRRYTQNVEAYNLFLQGRYHQYRWTLDGIQKSKQLFGQAVAIDPGFALAHLGMAMYHLHLGFFGFLAPKEAIPLCESAVRKALAADDALSEAHAMLAVLSVVQDYDWDSAERIFLRALELDPMSVDSRNFYDYYFLVPMGRFDESIQDAERALELDPLSAFLHFRLGFRRLLTRQFDRAAGQLRNALELDPSYHAAHWALATIHLQEGRIDDAVSACERFAALSGRGPWALGALGFVYAKADRASEARALLGELRELSESAYVAPSNIAKIYFGLGDNDQGFQHLERAVDERDGLVIHLGVDPFYDFLRTDPRYRSLLRRMHLGP